MNGHLAAKHVAMEIEQESENVTIIVRVSLQKINWLLKPAMRVTVSYIEFDSNIFHSKKSKNNNVQINLRPSGILSMG